MNDDLSGGRAGLGMYPLAAVRGAYDRYWEVVRRLVPWAPAQLEWDVVLHESWTAPDLVVGHTCGWPLVTQLLHQVRVVGTFQPAVPEVPEAMGPTYRSVLVARRPGHPIDFVGATAAVNAADSLSGWVSLLAAVHGPGSRWEGEVRWTGAHLASLRAVRDGAADIASIDAVSLALARRHHPDTVAGLVVIGYGPRVPCLPVIAGPAVSEARVHELRRAMASAFDHPDAAPAAAAMMATGFVALDLEHYLPLLDLAPAV